jgi:dienelactone hydrolase
MNLVSLTELIGPSPSRCPLNPTILSDVDCGTYVRQTVEYAVEEAERVKSFVLLPKNASGMAPAVIAHHQHAGQFDLGKSEVVGLAGNPDQAYGAELAECGYLVMAPDAPAFECESAPKWDPRTKTPQGFVIAYRFTFRVGS